MLAHPPDRPKLLETPELRDRLIEYISRRDAINKDLARKIVQAMDGHQLTLLELQARERVPQRWNPKFEPMPAPNPVVETEYHPYASRGE